METEGPKPIRSLHSDIPKFVIFVNRTNKLARAWWLDFSGNPVSYGDIPPNGELHMNTFITHPWIFRTTENGAALAANQQDVCYPTLEVDIVNITTPVYSLYACCLMAIRRLVTSQQDLNILDIPQTLKQDLLSPPNLREELKLLNSSAP
ncbi:von Hippel-Lindau-like protein [Engraulis encrasicolus]|uniref:von Hippel-Lindau-like protein n=1 Tax=Engraulis encrasicolus TaxID=184585 RepID=UPI002FD5143B